MTTPEKMEKKITNNIFNKLDSEKKIKQDFYGKQNKVDKDTITNTLWFKRKCQKSKENLISHPVLSILEKNHEFRPTNKKINLSTPLGTNLNDAQINFIFKEKTKSTNFTKNLHEIRNQIFSDNKQINSTYNNLLLTPNFCHVKVITSETIDDNSDIKHKDII